MKISALRAVWLVPLALASGCSHVRDVSSLPPYSRHVGLTHYLSREAELGKTHSFTPFTPSYEIVVDRYDGGLEDWLVAKLPKGYPVQVESVHREEGRTLLGDLPYREDCAIVSLEHPNHPGQRIRATICLRSCGDVQAFERADPFKDLSTKDK